MLSTKEESSSQEEILDRIKETLITKVPAYLSSNPLNFTGSENDIVDYRVKDCNVEILDTHELAFHGASRMYAAEIYLEEERKKKKQLNVHHVIVKIMPRNPIVRSMQNSVDQFYNECTILSSIIPFLLENCESTGHKNVSETSCGIQSKFDVIPKCYYSCHDPEDGIVVLEDLRKQGYKIGGNKMMLMDEDHIRVALQGLARFHALSYATKNKDFEGYKQHVVTKLADARRYFDKSTTDFSIDRYSTFLKYTTRIMLLELNKLQLEDGRLYTEKIMKLCEKLESYQELFYELMTPKEPLAVLCHGDFNRNNMLFCYDSTNRPVGVKILDFQTPYYASPAIDLGLVLLLNSTPELLSTEWDNLFCEYNGILRKTLSDFLECSEESLPSEYSVEGFKNEFSRHGIYCFMIACTFITSLAMNDYETDTFIKLADRGFPSLEEAGELMRSTVASDVEVARRLTLLSQVFLDNISV
ncbi:uncharacterized protein [Periplaneta americana]|uniref:uncharacterized protein n=1 Tax=Periplaneta americana TaxID=6978 RepID=UPI0037E816F7